LEGIEIGIAETVQIRQINGNHEYNEDDLIEWHKQQKQQQMAKDEAIKQYFMKPQLI
jgi:hypothetical protein